MKFLLALSSFRKTILSPRPHRLSPPSFLSCPNLSYLSSIRTVHNEPVPETDPANSWGSSSYETGSKNRTVYIVYDPLSGGLITKRGAKPSDNDDRDENPSGSVKEEQENVSDRGENLVGGTEAHVKKIVPENHKKLVLDGGFHVPEINAFGQNFRDYDAESDRKQGVENFYRNNHISQTVDFVRKMREEYRKMEKAVMSIWECCELLNEVVDESDPDLDEPQIEHLLQTAEAIRRDYPNQDWLHLTALIHDLGKVLLLPSFGGLPQWAVVGDTYPLGCAFDESIVHHKYLEGNPDYGNPAYNTKFGIYSEGCGLDNVLMSWGHDDYMYLVAKENNTTLPSAGLFIIRYHSFYALHRSGAYKHLMNEEDAENLKWLQIFSKYDLYSKSKVKVDLEKVKPYYLSLIEKYSPEKLKW